MQQPPLWSSEDRRRAALADFAHAFSHDEYSLDADPPPQPPPQHTIGLRGLGVGASPSPDPSLYLSPAGAIAHLGRHGHVVGPADLAPDGGARRHLIHVPRALAFSTVGGADFHFPSRVAEEGADEATDDEEEGEGHASMAGAEGQALLGLGQARPAPSSGLGVSALHEWKVNVDAEGRARRARGMARASSSSAIPGAATVKTPLLAQRSPLEGSSRSPLPMSLLGANDSFQHFTPQSRRTFIRRQLGANQVAQQRARRSWLWAWLCCGRENPFTVRRVTLVALLVSIALAHSGELVLRKVVASSLYNYRWFLYESVTMLTFLLAAVVALFKFRTVRHFLAHHGMPYRFLLLSSLLDATHALALVLAVGVLPSVWGVAVPQLVVPFALLFRFFVTDGERVGRWGLLGSTLLVGGVLALVIPHLLSYEPCISSAKSSAAELRTELLINVLILVVGAVPAAASAIYKQSYLQHHSMDIYLMNAAVSGLQLLWGLALAPLALELQYLGNSGVQQHGRARSEIDASGSASSSSSSSDGSSGDSSSSSASASLPVPSVHIHSASTESLTWTDDVSRNMFVNFREGWSCLAGINAEPGDTCQVSGTEGEGGGGGRREETGRERGDQSARWPWLPAIQLGHPPLTNLLTDALALEYVCGVYVCVCLLFQQLFPLPVVQLSLLIVSMSTLQLLLQYLMSRSSRENLLASALSGGVLLAVLLFQVPQVHEWLPSWELGDCLPPFDHFIAGGMAVLIIGAIIAQWEPSQQVRNENWQGTPLGMMRIATNCTAASLFSSAP